MVTTTNGQTATQVAQAVAASINNSVVLTVMGVTASSTGKVTTTDGAISEIIIADPGLATEVPALSDWGIWLLVMMVMIVGVVTGWARKSNWRGA